MCRATSCHRCGTEQKEGLFVNQEGTKLVADPSCPFSQTPPFGGPVPFYLLDNGVAGVQDDCVMTYPEAEDELQEVPIVDGQFTIEATRTDGLGEYTIMIGRPLERLPGRTSLVGRSQVLLAMRVLQVIALS
jgi:hypothetical protein